MPTMSYQPAAMPALAIPGMIPGMVPMMQMPSPGGMMPSPQQWYGPGAASGNPFPL